MHAVLRTHNDPEVKNLIRRLSATQRINEFVVVIDKQNDLLDTPSLLKTIDYTKGINPVLLEDYGWSKALNAGINSLPPMINEQELVLVISNEAQITVEEIDLLIEAASEKSASCGYVLFDGRREPTYRLPRNTCIVWKRKLFDEIGLFDTSLDRGNGTGTGMEDYEMVLRGFNSKGLSPFIGPKAVKLELRPDFDLTKKLEWEERGITIIEAMYPEEVVIQVCDHIDMQNRTD